MASCQAGWCWGRFSYPGLGFELLDLDGHAVGRGVAGGVVEIDAAHGKRVEARKGGIVWHTQGSGKSISMVCFAAKLMQQPEMQNPTLVVVTDRNDLDGQLFQTFAGARALLQEDEA